MRGLPTMAVLEVSDTQQAQTWVMHDCCGAMQRTGQAH